MNNCSTEQLPKRSDVKVNKNYTKLDR